MFQIKRLSLLILLVQLSGCAVMSKTDCLDADWYRVGRDVGKQGEQDKVAAFNKRAELCSKYGVVADLVEFEAGHKEGMLQYCEVDNAVREGVRGASKALVVCPEDENPGFIAAYDAGLRLYELRRAEAEARHQLERIENSENRIRQRINTIRRSVTQDSSEEQRREANRRIRYLRRDMNNNRYDARAYQQHYYKAKEAADAYAEYLELEYGDL